MTFLDKLKALDAKATPSPWTLTPRTCDIGCCDNIQRINAQYPGDSVPDRDVGSMNGGNAVWLRSGEAEANAPLLILLRNSAPRLAALIEAVGEYISARDADVPRSDAWHLNEVAAMDRVRSALADLDADGGA